MRFVLKSVLMAAACLAAGTLPALGGEKALVDTSESPAAKMYMVDLADVHWAGGLWGERFDVCQHTMIPHMWEHLFKDPRQSAAWENFLVAAGQSKGRGDNKGHGPPFNDGDFLKWLEAAAQMYAVTKDPALDKLMDEIIAVVAKAQREDGYLHTQTIIPQRFGDKSQKEFEEREHFETYNMGHLMTTAAVHYRATGKTTLLEPAKKAADYLYAFYKRSSPDLARNAICPSHYMGVVELYRITREPRYLELAKQLIEIRDQVTNGTDHNQDRVPFRKMTKAVGHAVRANYLYSGVADVVAEDGDRTLLSTLDKIDQDVAEHKLYITGMTGAKYDAASPEGSSKHSEIALAHQAYGRDWELPNLTAYNETCATIGYAIWQWRMLTLTGDARHADLFENSLINGVLPGISLEGKDYFYVNPLRKIKDFDWPLRWSRTRVPNIPSSFCCPPNVLRTIAEAHNYVYSLSRDTLWVHLYNSNALNTTWLEKDGGGRIRLRQETDYPWQGAVKLTVDEAPDRPITLKVRVPGFLKDGEATLKVNGQPVDTRLIPGTYADVRRAWRAGDVVSFDMTLTPRLMEANPLVEETLNQVAVKRGPIVYCLESNDLPEGVSLKDVAVALDPAKMKFVEKKETIVNATVLTLTMPALQLARPAGAGGKALYREASLTPPREIQIKLVPYFAWGNRGDTDMSVWLPAR
jgi:DUF1680 family protein